jgi:hypothetical protein
MKLRRSSALLIAALALAPLPGRAADAPTFDQLAQTGFTRVAAASDAPAAPAAAPVASPAPRAESDGRGVYLNSERKGQIFFCSSGGCRELLDGGAGVVLASGSGLYFTGPEGTGYCTPASCRVLIPGAAVVFPLNAGPRGDLYAVDHAGLWHCDPSSCARAFTGAVDVQANFMDGAWKANGDFVASAYGRTFWCSRGECRPIAETEIVFVDETCNNAAPSDAAFGFWGITFYRCTAAGCRALTDSDNIQTYSTCAFDPQGRIYLESRAQVAMPSMRCGDAACVPSDRKVTAVAPEKAPAADSQSNGSLVGTDGAIYRLADRSGTPEPKAGDAAPGLAPIVERGAQRLTVDAPVECWDWTAGDDDDEEPASWFNSCRLIR